ncbi:hypothetical protein [Nocardioides sp. MH1]|uniref:hypothetical protein n=1 Tax=Nocardioides sp. MH1 TaxID=3242490 RepID=UPI003520CA4C
MPGPLRWLLLAVLVTVLPVAAGVLVLDDDEPSSAPPTPPAPRYASTPLADYDTTTVALTRAPFCDRLPDDAVTEAIGKVRDTTSYRNGQRVEIAAGVDDVAHEYGCRIIGTRGDVRAWVFAPPVTPAGARDLAAQARESGESKSCTRPAQAPAYGVSSVALVCPSGNRRWASFRGLFGDAWLSCSLSAPASLGNADLLDRAGRWCVAVAEAAAVAPTLPDSASS